MTRAVHGWNWFLWRRKESTSVYTAKQQLVIGVMVVLLLFSAFSVIYLRDLSRRLFIQYQTLQQAQTHNEIEWNKLLLEEGAWSTQARIQYLASQRLKMITPQPRDIKIVE